MRFSKPMLLAIVASIALNPPALFAQKKVLSLPFEFEKARLAASDYDAYFLNNDRDSTFALILKDNKKAEYVLVDKNFKIVSKVDADIKSTVFKEDVAEYRGGTTNGQVYSFIYEDKKPVGKGQTPFQLEKVDFSAKTVTHSKAFEIPKSEKVLSSFSDNNNFFAITADDKTKELAIYNINESGSFRTQRIPFKIPETAGKKRDNISEYLTNLQVFKQNEEADLSAAVSPAKLFCRPDRLEFVINESEHPAHIFSIQLPAMTASEKFIDFSNFKPGGKDKIAVNSFLRNDKLFSLVLDKKTIRIAVHDALSGTLKSKYEINEESSFAIFARYPMNETRMGKRSEETDVDDIKKLIRALQKGTEGVMISENSKGQLIVTIGTYNLVPQRSGGSGGKFVTTPTISTIGPTPGVSLPGATTQRVTTWSTTYIPGAPSYTTTNARYYTSTTFKLLLDPSGAKLEKGKLNTTVPDQIKDYMEGVDPKAKATNQFSMGPREFYGFYDRELKAYVVEEIRIRR